VSQVRDVPTSVGMVGMRCWGDGPPEVVLLHGAGGNRDSLVPLGDAIAALGVPVATLSMPGRGGSDGDGITSIADVASWLAAVLDEVAPDGVVLLGHSMGGGIAIETALATDAALRGLVLVATGARLRVLPAILEHTAEVANQGGSLAEFSVASLEPDAPDHVRQQVMEAAAATPASVAAADWQATDAFDRLHDLDALDLPVLAVAGADDHLTPVRNVDWIEAHARNVRTAVLPNAGHWFPVERPAEVADLIAALLAQLGGPGQG
jgi:pimeloyl-ACP methyl ester carboxylesterase